MEATGEKSPEHLSASNEPGRRGGRSFAFVGSAAYFGMLSVILFAALSNGIADVWHKALFVTLISAVGVLRLLDGIMQGGIRFARSRLLLPLGGILLLAIFQITAWPVAGSPISVDPYDTKVFFAAFGGVAVAFEILCCYSNSVSRLNLLVGLVLIVGFGSAIFGILLEHFPSLPTGLLARFPEPEQGFGQFYNRNHFALLMEMPVGLLLGILIKGELSDKKRFAGWLALALMIYALIAASSRGGLISLAALFFFAVFVHLLTLPRSSSLKNRSSHGSIAVFRKSAVVKTVAALCLSIMIVVFVWAAIGFVGGDYVVSRIERIDDELSVQKANQVNRNIIWHSTIDLIKDRPILGSGLGAFAEAIPRFDRANGKFYLQQAHNDYLEVLAGGGVVGFSLFAIFGWAVTVRILKNLRSNDPAIRPLCFGATVGIFAVLIHSFVDFGLHIMVNALIFTVLVAVATVDGSAIQEKGV